MSFDEPRTIHPSLIYGMDEKQYAKWKPDRNGQITTGFQIKKRGGDTTHPFYGKKTRVDIEIRQENENVEYPNHHFAELVNIFGIIGWDIEKSIQLFQLNCPRHSFFLTDKETTAVKKYLSLITNEEVWSNNEQRKPKKGFG